MSTAPMTVLEVIAAINNPFSKEAMDLINDQFQFAIAKKELSEMQDLRMKLIFLNEKIEQQNKYREELRAQAYKEELEYLHEQKEKLTPELKSTLETQIQIAKDIISNFETTWSNYQETATKENREFLQHAFNNGELLNNNGEKINQATLDKLLANAATANPLAAYQPYAVSIIQAGIALDHHDATAIATKTSTGKLIRDLVIIGQDNDLEFSLTKLLKKIDTSIKPDEIRRKIAKYEFLKEKDVSKENEYSTIISGLIDDLRKAQTQVSSFISESTSKMYSTIKLLDDQAKEATHKALSFCGEKMAEAIEAVNSLVTNQHKLDSSQPKENSFKLNNK